MKDSNRKNIKTFVEPLTCTSHLSKWNVPRYSSTNPAPIDRTYWKLKLKGNPSTEVEPKNKCCDPLVSNDKYLDNDSINTLKRDLQKCLPSSGFFLFHDTESKCSKNSEKEQIERDVVKLDKYMKQIMTQTLKLKLLVNIPCLLMNFMIFHKILWKIWLIHMLSIFHQLMKKSNILNILPAANNLLTCGGSMEKKNSHHLTYILQLLTK